MGQVIIDVGDENQIRQKLYMLNYRGLHKLSKRAYEKKFLPITHLLIVIDADDKTWDWLTEALMPSENWDAWRQKGMKPIARGIVPWELFENDLPQLVPALALVIKRRHEAKNHWVLVCGDQGATLRELI